MQGKVILRKISPIQGKVIFTIEHITKKAEGNKPAEVATVLASISQEQLKTMQLMGASCPNVGSSVEFTPNDNSEWVDLSV